MGHEPNKEVALHGRAVYQLSWSVWLPLELGLLLAASLLEPSLARPRQPLGAKTFDVSWSQGWPPASHRSISCESSNHWSLEHRCSFMLCGHCHPVQQRESSFWGSDVVGPGPGSPARSGHHLLWTCTGGHGWSLLLWRSKEIEKEEQAAARKAVTQEEFRSKWTALASKFTVAQPKVTGWSEGMQVPSVPFHWFLGEDHRDQPTTEDWPAAPTAQATK